MKGITRRRFVVGTAAAAASLGLGQAAPALAGRMGGGMGGGGMGGGTGVIDPPVGGAFRDPAEAPNLSSAPGEFEVALDARRAGVSVAGATADLWTYNGEFPGPTIRVEKTDLLRVRLTNHLPRTGEDPNATNMLGHPKFHTNLHTHGLHVTPGDNDNGTHGDNMMVMLMPGMDGMPAVEEVYEYHLGKHPGGNLNFYHPHLHGSVADQMWGGMAGALVVEDEHDLLAGYETHLMVLKDIGIANGEPAPHSSMMDYMHGKEGDTVMVNGVVNPRLSIAPGQVQRWRVVNASTARFYRLALAGHSLHLIGTEGGLMPHPVQVSELLLAPGERADILVKATGTAGTSYKLYSLPYSRQGNMGGQQVTLLTLAYPRKSDKYADVLPAQPLSDTVRLVPGSAGVPIAKTVPMSLSMGQGRGYINGRTFWDHTDCFSTHSMLDTYEIWEVSNASGMDHPFHQHVNHCQVLSISGGDANYRNLWTTQAAWKDTVIVPKWGSVRLLVPVMDYDGMAMFHCHIIEHEDIGMMGMWHLGHMAM